MECYEYASATTFSRMPVGVPVAFPRVSASLHVSEKVSATFRMNMRWVTPPGIPPRVLSPAVVRPTLAGEWMEAYRQRSGTGSISPGVVRNLNEHLSKLSESMAEELPRLHVPV